MRNIVPMLSLVLLAFLRGPTSLSSQKAAYVFSPRGDYVTVDLASGNVSQVRHLQGIGSMDRIFPTSAGGRILAQSSRVESAAGETSVAVLDVLNVSMTKAEVGLSESISGPKPSSDLLWANVFRGKTDFLVTTWQDADLSYRSLAQPIGSNSNIRDLDGLILGPTSCMSPNGKTVYVALAGKDRIVETLDVESLTVSHFSYDSVGARGAFYKAPGAADGCTVALIQRNQRFTPENSVATVYIYDLLTKTVQTKFPIEGDGHFALSMKAHLLALDESELVPNVLPSGATVGAKLAKPGRLRLYDLLSGTRVSDLTVPVDGTVAAKSSDGSVLYYVSPNLLTVIDLTQHRVIRSMALPFSESMVAVPTNP